MTAMTPAKYYELFVMGNQSDFLENPGSVRHAFNAAVAASHMADHYFEYSQHHSPDIRFNELKALIKHANAATNGAFQSMRSIAIAYKHLYCASVYTDVSSAGAVYSISIMVENEPAEVIAEKEHYGHCTVCFTKTNGDEQEFRSILDSVVNFWSGFLDKTEE